MLALSHCVILWRKIMKEFDEKMENTNGRGLTIMEFEGYVGDSPFWKFQRQGEFKLWKPSVHSMLWIFFTFIAHYTVILVLKS